jgi:hypothetical protein
VAAVELAGRPPETVSPAQTILAVAVAAQTVGLGLLGLMPAAMAAKA